MNEEEQIENDKVSDGTLDDPDIRDCKPTNEIINLETAVVKSRMQNSIDKCDWTLVEKEDIPKVQFFILLLLLLLFTELKWLQTNLTYSSSDQHFYFIVAYYSLSYLHFIAHVIFDFIVMILIVFLLFVF